MPVITTLSDAFLKVSRFPLNKDKSHISLQLGFIGSWMAVVAYIFVKLTFFILYWNIFYPFRWLRFGIIGGATIVVAFYTALIIASFVGAIPPAGSSWVEHAPKSHNNIDEKLSVPLGVVTLVSDVYILILPISGVLRLALSWKKKFGLSMLFMAGVG